MGVAEQREPTRNFKTFFKRGKKSSGSLRSNCSEAAFDPSKSRAATPSPMNTKAMNSDRASISSNLTTAPSGPGNSRASSIHGHHATSCQAASKNTSSGRSGTTPNQQAVEHDQCRDKTSIEFTAGSTSNSKAIEQSADGSNDSPLRIDTSFRPATESTGEKRVRIRLNVRLTKGIQIRDCYTKKPLVIQPASAPTSEAQSAECVRESDEQPRPDETVVVLPEEVKLAPLLVDLGDNDVFSWKFKLPRADAAIAGAGSPASAMSVVETLKAAKTIYHSAEASIIPPKDILNTLAISKTEPVAILPKDLECVPRMEESGVLPIMDMHLSKGHEHDLCALEEISNEDVPVSLTFSTSDVTEDVTDVDSIRYINSDHIDSVSIEYAHSITHAELAPGVTYAEPADDLRPDTPTTSTDDLLPDTTTEDVVLPTISIDIVADGDIWLEAFVENVSNIPDNAAGPESVDGSDTRSADDDKSQVCSLQFSDKEVLCLRMGIAGGAFDEDGGHTDPYKGAGKIVEALANPDGKTEINFTTAGVVDNAGPRRRWHVPKGHLVTMKVEFKDPIAQETSENTAAGDIIVDEPTSADSKTGGIRDGAGDPIDEYDGTSNTMATMGTAGKLREAPSQHSTGSVASQ